MEENNNLQNNVTNLGANVIGGNTGGLSYNPNLNTTTTTNTIPPVNNISQQPVGVPFTPENPTNNGVVTNSVVQQPNISVQNTVSQPQMNVQQVIQQSVNEQAAAQAVQTTTSTGVFTSQVNTVSQQPVQPVQQPVVNENTVTEQPVVLKIQEENQEEEVIDKPKATAAPKVVNNVVELSENLKYLVSQIKNVANSDAYIPLSHYLYIEADSNGLTLVANNKANSIRVTDTTYSYTTELKICVNADKFINLVNNLDKGEVELIYNEEQSYLTVKTSTGEFRFPEQADESSGETISIDLLYDVNNITFKPFNYTAFLNTIINSKAIRALSKNTDATAGIYYTDLVISTDTNLILMEQGLPDLVDNEFFIGCDLADLIYGLKFDTDKVQIGFVEQNGAIIAVALKDSNMVLVSMTKENEVIPVDTCRDYWNKDFPDAVTLDTKKCVNILRRAKVFLTDLTNSDFAKFAITGDTLKVVTLNGESNDTLKCQNTNNSNTPVMFLPVVKLSNLLSTVTTPTYQLLTKPEEDAMVCVRFDKYKCIVATGNEDTSL